MEGSMANHLVYSKIIKAMKSRNLVEPFSINDFRFACPGFGNGTYKAFLYKHRKGNPSGNIELFDLVAPGKFRLSRPFLYGL
jgi:hypothetical protein